MRNERQTQSASCYLCSLTEGHIIELPARLTRRHLLEQHRALGVSSVAQYSRLQTALDSMFAIKGYGSLGQFLAESPRSGSSFSAGVVASVVASALYDGAKAAMHSDGSAISSSAQRPDRAPSIADDDLRCVLGAFIRRKRANERRDSATLSETERNEDWLADIDSSFRVEVRLSTPSLQDFERLSNDGTRSSTPPGGFAAGSCRYVQLVFTMPAESWTSPVLVTEFLYPVEYLQKGVDNSSKGSTLWMSGTDLVTLLMQLENLLASHERFRGGAA